MSIDKLLVPVGLLADSVSGRCGPMIMMNYLSAVLNILNTSQCLGFKSIAVKIIYSVAKINFHRGARSFTGG